MNEGVLSMFPFKTRVRQVIRDGEPWFASADVCTALGLGNLSEALRDLDEDEKDIIQFGAFDRYQVFSSVSEPGLYRLVFQSDTPEARQFQALICGKVLPSIREKGEYGL
jgi:prophage antirepressor-like protein